MNEMFSLDVADIHMRLRGLNFLTFQSTFTQQSLQIQIDGFS